MLEHSRALRLAADVTRASQETLQQRLEDAVTVVSLDPSFAGASLTATMLLTTLRRLPGHLHLRTTGLPQPLIEQLTAAVHAIDPTRGITTGPDTPPDAVVKVHVGPDGPAKTIRIVPEGYGASLVGLGHASMRVQRRATALGSAYAAALGAAEVFKYTASVVPERRVLHQKLRFCPVTLSEDLHQAPDLPRELQLDLVMIGLGAIGTATACILAKLPATGRLTLVDPERYERENLGTYSLGGAREATERPWKADLAATALAAYDTVSLHDTVEQYMQGLERQSGPWPQTVLTGLDNIEARHQAQRLWPDQLIDGATGDTMLGLHSVIADGQPCLQCFFPTPTDRPSSIDLLAQATGLPPEQLARGDEPLKEEEVAHLSTEQQHMLRPQIGKPKCGLANAIGLTDATSNDYRPSVPFVSQQAACLAVGRLLAGTLGLASLTNFVQYDGLTGPQQATLEQRSARPGCYCQRRQSTIQHVRVAHRTTL